MKTHAEAALDYQRRYEQWLPELAANDTADNRAMRRQALDQLAEQGFPDRKQEDWRYSNIRPILEQVFRPAMDADRQLRMEHIAHLLPADETEVCLVSVNGRFQADLSRLDNLPEGVELSGRPWLAGPIGPEHRHAFQALNTAGCNGGLQLDIHRPLSADTPIHIVHIQHAGDKALAVMPAWRISLHAGANAIVNEYFHAVGDSRYLFNGRCQIELEAGARLQHHRLQDESPQAFHLSEIRVDLAQGADYRSLNLATGGLLGRCDLQLNYQAPGATARLDGLYLGQHGQTQDFHTRVEHRQPDCTTRQCFKGILSDSARGVFDGLIHVHPDAQHSDAQMRNDNLLLSREAEVDTKPRLLIHADDVKCAHGATVGELDQNALFYLRSRGIAETEARKLLLGGFALDLFADVEHSATRERFEYHLNQRLEALHA